MVVCHSRADGNLHIFVTFPHHLIIYHNHHTAIIRINGEDGMRNISCLEEYKKALHLVSELDNIINNNHTPDSYAWKDGKKKIKSETLVSVDKYEIIGLLKSWYHLESISETSMDSIIKTTFMKISTSLIVCWDRLLDRCNTRSFSECTCNPECGVSICCANLEYSIWCERSYHIV